MVNKRSRVVNESAGSKSKPKLAALLQSPEVDSWRALMRAFQSIYQQLEKSLLVEDCSISRFQILFVLYMEGPLPAVKIARRLLVTRGNISTFIKRLHADELIMPIVIKPEQKRPFFQLTAKGRDLFESLFPRHIERVKKLMKPLSKEVLQTLDEISKTRLPKN